MRSRGKGEGNGMKLYEPRRCIGQRKNGTLCSFLSSSSFPLSFTHRRTHTLSRSLYPRRARSPFLPLPEPLAPPQNPLGQTVFFAPLLYPKIFVSDSPVFLRRSFIRSFSLPSWTTHCFPPSAPRC